LISDIGLPDGAGWEMLERARLPHPLFGIDISGVGRNIDTSRSLAGGYRHHLFKPFPLAYLNHLLEEAA
jgi:hypothetical protein